MSRAAHNVQGPLCIGGQALDSRSETIRRLFTLNRRAGALWVLAEEPSAAHVVRRSRDMAIIFVAEILPLRLPSHDEMTARPAERTALRPHAESSGFLGNTKTQSFWKVGERETTSYPTAWLPTQGAPRHGGRCCWNSRLQSDKGSNQQ